MKVLRKLLNKTKTQKPTMVYQRDLNRDSVHALLETFQDYINEGMDIRTMDKEILFKSAQDKLEEWGIYYVYREGKEHTFNLDDDALDFIVYVFFQTLLQKRSVAVNFILERYGVL